MEVSVRFPEVYSIASIYFFISFGAREDGMHFLLHSLQLPEIFFSFLNLFMFLLYSLETKEC